MIDAIRSRAATYAGDRFFYGWAIVGIAAIMMFSSGPGQSYTFSVFLDPISLDLGISHTTIATAYAFATFAAAFLLPRTGVLLDRFGPRKALILAACLLGVACMFFGAASNFLWLAAGFAALRFMGQGATMMCTANLVSQWFSRRRGFAMSLMALGFAASMAIHPPLGSYLIEQYGWRTAWVILGVLTWLVMLPPIVLLAYDKPEAIGLTLDGDDEVSGQTSSSEPAADSGNGLTLPEAKQQRAFYLLCAVWFIIGGLVTVLHFFQVSILGDRGFSSQDAAQLFTISAITMVVTMPLIGRLFDAVRSRYVIAAALTFNALALICITLVSSYASAVLYAVIFGATNAFMMTMFGYIWPRYFGRTHLGSIQGMGQMFGVVGASIAPVPVGYAIDTFNSASGVLRGLSVIELAMAVAVVMLLRTPPGVDVPAGLE
ncbi:hypothetical protein AB833_31960 [Chromatiales bacterium (ex Bugula neritina AB1)]|nr:hypothetical protein AB833_31960 [Chromatiales bacterium (ex Bugula neritina AB1)]